MEYQKALMMTLHSIWLQMMYYGCALLCEAITVEDQIDAVLLCVCCFGGIVIWYHTKQNANITSSEITGYDAFVCSFIRA